MLIKAYFYSTIKAVQTIIKGFGRGNYVEGGWLLARGPALPLTLLPSEACAHKNDHARAKRAPPTELKSRGKKAKHTVELQ